jgi:hypothetical protein
MRMLTYANHNGVPVWSAVRLLDFIKARDEASFSDIEWKNNWLSFRLNSSLDNSNGLTFLVPYRYGDNKIARITCAEKESSFIIRSVRGSEYAFVTIKPGQSYSVKVNYNN